MYEQRMALRRFLLEHGADPGRVPALMTLLRPYFAMADRGRYVMRGTAAPDAALKDAIAAATDRRVNALVRVTLDGVCPVDEASFVLNGRLGFATLASRAHGGAAPNGRMRRLDADLSEVFMASLGRPLAAAFGAEYTHRFRGTFGEGFGTNLCCNLALNVGETLYLLTRAVCRGDEKARAALFPVARMFDRAVPLCASPLASGAWIVFRGDRAHGP